MSDVPRRLVALTFDYETWQPIPPGKHIDWDADVFAPAQQLIEGDVPVTLFAEMGEYFWLDANDPPIARRMEEQWRDAIRRGHDVQLHLHTAWLPECGATHVDGEWHWDTRYAKADDYPGDLDALIERCVTRLHDVLRPVDPEYRVTCFRAGAYQAQPFRRLSAALIHAGIHFDSSVYAGGVSQERGYDYSHAHSDGQPYFASPYDPQLRGTPAETGIVELPIAVERGTRVMLDGAEGASFDRRVMRRGGEYTVTIGHTKGGLRTADVLTAARRLAAAGYGPVTLSTLAKEARGGLEARAPEAAAATKGDSGLLDSLPLDRERVLVLGPRPDGLDRYPWVQAEHADPAAAMDESFDCVYADGAIEQAHDVDALLRDCHRVLGEGGVLVARVAAHGPWVTIPGEVDERLTAAGFVDIDADDGSSALAVRAWKRTRPATQRERANEAIAWLYRHLDPRTPTTAQDPLEVIAGGVAFCAGYAIALRGLLDREGIEARIVQMTATGHPRGSGSHSADTHVVVQARLDGSLAILDAMAGTTIPHGLEELLAQPALARGRQEPDDRYRERGYELYDTGFWYSRVSRYRVYRSRVSRWRRNPHRAPLG